MQIITSWTSRSGDLRLDFYEQNPSHNVIAKIFDKNVNQEFVERNYLVNERSIFVEGANVHQLMRGVPQETKCFAQLNWPSKEAILSSLSSRNITVENGFGQSSLTIHALP